MPQKKYLNKFLAMVILIMVTSAPFLDSVACADCHLIFPQGSPLENHLTITNLNRTLSPHDFFAYGTPTSSEKQAERDNSPCPFCIFDIFGVVSQFHPEIIFSSTSLLNQKDFLTLLEPIFLKTRPPKS